MRKFELDAHALLELTEKDVEASLAAWGNSGCLLNEAKGERLTLLDRMLFEPNKKIYSLESDYSPSAKTLTVPSTDDVTLHAWLFPSEGTPKKGVVLQVHGNAENLTSHAPYVAWMAKHGYDVISWDYRGYGRSSGTPSKEGCVRDTETMLKKAITMTAHSRLVIVAQSVGAALALHAISRVGLPTRSQIVLEGAFADFRRLAAIRIRQKYHPWLSRLVPLLFSGTFNAIDAARSLTHPTLSLHSEDDEIIPIEEHRTLFEAIPTKEKIFWTIRGQKHLDAFRNDESPYRQRLIDYLG